jgi:hypothetical protein
MLLAKPAVLLYQFSCLSGRCSYLARPHFRPLRAALVSSEFHTHRYTGIMEDVHVRNDPEDRAGGVELTLMINGELLTLNRERSDDMGKTCE